MFFASLADMKLVRHMVRNPVVADFFGPVMTRAALEQRHEDWSPERKARLGRTINLYAVLVVLLFLISVVGGGMLLVALFSGVPLDPGAVCTVFATVLVSVPTFLVVNRHGAELESAVARLTQEADDLQPISLADCSHMNMLCQATPEGRLFRFCVLEEARAFTKGEMAMMADWFGAIEQRKAHYELYCGE